MGCRGGGGGGGGAAGGAAALKSVCWDLSFIGWKEKPAELPGPESLDERKLFQTSHISIREMSFYSALTAPSLY